MLKKCNSCNIPETYETIEFDNKGKCNICSQHEYKNSKIDWTKRKNDFEKIINHYKDKNDYDCIVPFSGGKDSTYTLFKLVNDYKIKPLVVQFNHGFMRQKVNDPLGVRAKKRKKIKNQQ